LLKEDVMHITELLKLMLMFYWTAG